MDDFIEKQTHTSFIQDAKTGEALLQKELIVLRSEEELLQERIRIMKEFVTNLPSLDPQYNMIQLALKMDEIDLAEHHARKATLLQRLQDLTG